MTSVTLLRLVFVGFFPHTTYISGFLTPPSNNPPDSPLLTGSAPHSTARHRIHHVLQHDPSHFKHAICPYLFPTKLQCNQSTIPTHSYRQILSGPGSQNIELCEKERQEQQQQWSRI